MLLQLLILEVSLNSVKFRILVTLGLRQKQKLMDVSGNHCNSKVTEVFSSDLFAYLPEAVSHFASLVSNTLDVTSSIFGADNFTHFKPHSTKRQLYIFPLEQIITAEITNYSHQKQWKFLKWTENFPKVWMLELKTSDCHSGRLAGSLQIYKSEIILFVYCLEWDDELEILLYSI